MNCAVHTDTPAAAYCRTCGKALCENCKRDVMGAIYCEPCIAVRLHDSQTQAARPPITTVPGTPSPGVAMLLGFIPGVGAMYNSQFLKGLIHVMIFVVLIIASDHTGPLDVLFGVLIPFFIFYMAFDAYKTAEARRMGLPAPDLLGLDRLFGLQENTMANTPAAGPGVAMPSPEMAPGTRASADHMPVGAAVLIILGVVLLLSNLTDLHLHRLWPLALVAIGLWLAYKRLAVTPGGVQ